MVKAYTKSCKIKYGQGKISLPALAIIESLCYCSVSIVFFFLFSSLFKANSLWRVSHNIFYILSFAYKIHANGLCPHSMQT